MNKFAGTFLSIIVKVYQNTIGIAFGGHCRFYPSCSEYSRQSFSKYGAIKGLLMSFWRVLRCNPWNHGGSDPVK